MPTLSPRHSLLLLAAALSLNGCFLFKSAPADPALVRAAELQAPRIVELSRQTAAFEALSQTGEATPDQALVASRSYWQLGLAQENSDRRDDAVKALQRASDWARWGLRSLSQSAQLEIARAEAELRLSWTIGMGEAMAHTLPAVLALQAAKKLAPTDPDFEAARARSWIYLPRLGGGDPGKAQDFWLAMTQVKGADAWTDFWAAEACRQNGNKEKAAELYAQALELDPSLGLARIGQKKLR